VVKQQDPDGFTSNVRYQLAFHGLLGYQTYGPSRAPFGRITANHRDNPLFLASIERDGCSWTLLIVERPLQALFLIASSDLAHRFGRQPDIGRHFGHRLAVVQLGERESAKNHSNWLNTTSKQQVDFVPVTLGKRMWSRR
jgi:hypothetical protein